MTNKEKIKLVDNPNTSAQQLEILADSRHSYIRYRLVHHPNCPPKALAILANTKEWQFCHWVAQHPNCPLISAIELLDLGYIGYRKRKGF